MKEFLSVPELRDNPLVQRVADVLDSNRSGEVDFKGKISTKEYICMISTEIFSRSGRCPR